jgi:hypothetical protein
MERSHFAKAEGGAAGSCISSSFTFSSSHEYAAEKSSMEEKLTSTRARFAQARSQCRPSRWLKSCLSFVIASLRTTAASSLGAGDSCQPPAGEPVVLRGLPRDDGDQARSPARRSRRAGEGLPRDGGVGS